jgi:succinate dehydrogenase/fumarate reductase-like Fe-S protein
MYRHQCAGQICGVHRLQMGEIQVLGTMKQMMMMMMMIIMIIAL